MKRREDLRKSRTLRTHSQMMLKVKVTYGDLNLDQTSRVNVLLKKTQHKSNDDILQCNFNMLISGNELI